MPHATAPRFKPHARLEPAQQHWWQARKADTLTVAPRVAPTRRWIYFGIWEKGRNRELNRQANRRIGRRTKRQTDRQANRQIDR